VPLTRRNELESPCELDEPLTRRNEMGGCRDFGGMNSGEDSERPVSNSILFYDRITAVNVAWNPHD
jgi:hypothetical protein